MSKGSTRPPRRFAVRQQARGFLLCCALLRAWPALADDTFLDQAAERGIVVESAVEVWNQEGAAWPRWNAHDPHSRLRPDYRDWRDFMRDYGEPGHAQGALDFVHVVNRGMGALAKFVYLLEQVPVSSLRRDEQLAYWLNLHNARAVELTAASLRTISEDDETTRELVLGEKWREKSLTVEGEALSLVDIERRIVMRQWPDPRVQYGLYMPAMGAPGVPQTAFTGATVWKRLGERAHDFINSRRATEFYEGQLYVSALYFWDQGLFPNDAAVIAHLRAYADAPLKSRLAKVRKVSATYFNWRINSFNSGYDRHQDRLGGGSPL
ncbi:Protein of unknown function, DUF547 [Solimonas aquatica]|uniref:DUF547 domain-containing protein n=1 Tax=Solimonas aquatica TaxID=489703 RepID=A0A1H9BKT6_9GAMM|nr:DUF547 domain-containing protein [Solimonas aquatica]SEP89576.1 Protein of unknown function, DUF547 [Solimonas aquatica]